jgi:hypothetical protein
MHMSARSALRCTLLTLLSRSPVSIVETSFRTTDGSIHELASASFQGRTYEARGRHGAACAVARLLVEAGCPDGPWQTGGRQGTVGLSGRSLHKLARLMVREDAERGPEFARWEPHPRSLAR